MMVAAARCLISSASAGSPAALAPLSPARPRRSPLCMRRQGYRTDVGICRADPSLTSHQGTRPPPLVVPSSTKQGLRLVHYNDWYCLLHYATLQLNA
jgi:hypothetical protein